MEERTRAYLRGRFGDHYRRVDPDLPPAPGEREWGYIPWRAGGTTMVRHRSLLDIGDVSDFLARERPRHVYFSAGRYDDPSADRMSAKGWRGSDLVFDLDADHLDGVDEETPYAEMLAACREELLALLDLLDRDLGVADPAVVFSGGRGYHVHVRDRSFRRLDSEARSAVADHVRGASVDADTVIETVSREGVNRRRLRADGGWGRRVHRRLLAFADDLPDDRAAALDQLRTFEGIGEKRAESILTALRERREAVEAGEVELGGTGLRRLVAALAEETVAAEGAHIDEPVTTDVNRLIRLPGSLHGGTGLAVTPVGDPASFDPLSDAVAETFRGHEVRVETTEPTSVRFDDQTFTVSHGIRHVPEHVAVFLMARGHAEKAQE
jgi:DNA primase small subunit